MSHDGHHPDRPDHGAARPPGGPPPRAHPGDSPSPTALGVLAVVCAVLALLGLADYAVVQRRRRGERDGPR
jgi:hypothetical protein